MDAENISASEDAFSNYDQPMACKAAPDCGQRVINLALQGGGSHGAFTWGVLDALLEDGRLCFEGVSGTSAGAMNAVVMAHAFARGQKDGLGEVEKRQAARDALSRFWDSVGTVGSLVSSMTFPPAAQSMMNMFSQFFSPAQTNPFDINPLRKILEREVDFDLLYEFAQMQVFVCATNVNTGRGEIFTKQKLSADAVMASACLPMLFQTITIDNQPYWDGGYSGNPAIYPLIYDTKSCDILLVQINPTEINFDKNVSAQDILERINEITFNSSLMAEMRAIAFVRRLLDENKLDPKRYKRILLHQIDGGKDLIPYGASSKQKATSSFVRELFALGRKSGINWLAEHFDNLGVCDGILKK